MKDKMSVVRLKEEKSKRHRWYKALVCPLDQDFEFPNMDGVVLGVGEKKSWKIRLLEKSVLEERVESR
jgi:hypothetical protein